MRVAAEEWYKGRRRLEYELGETELEEFIEYCNPKIPEQEDLIRSLGWEGIFKQYKGVNWLEEEYIISIETGYGFEEELGNLFNDYLNEGFIEPVIKWTDDEIYDYTNFELVGEND